MNSFSEELSYMLARHKALTVPEYLNSHELSVRSKVRKSLGKALGQQASEFELVLTHAQYKSAIYAVEALYDVFKTVIEDEDEKNITLTITIQ